MARKPSRASVDAGRFARKLHSAGTSGCPTKRVTAEMGGYRRFRAARDYAADNGLVFWQFDHRRNRYFWGWSEAQAGAEQTWKGIRTRMRRQVLRHRSALLAAGYGVPDPGVPFQATGPFMSTLYDSLVSVGVLYWIVSTGKENNVPLATIQAEATTALMSAVFPTR